ncbi:MAG TPA: L,D-transpeptidase [Pyrinomonadaceae bacterium]|nr:L,D-transpeptidase [Pyrinomonadaceae bacterium]
MMNGGGLLFVLIAGACVAAGVACASRGTARAETTVPGVADGGVGLTREEELNRRPLKLPLEGARVVVEKGARRLRLYAGGELVRVRRVALGFTPEGDKVRQGDGRTPEGEFQVCMKNPKSSFYLSLGLTYPNAEDAERGLRDGLITRAQHKGITRALAGGRCPPWNTALGGEIFIHGGGTASDWTFGCVALENPEIKELFDALPAGTPVRILP